MNYLFENSAHLPDVLFLDISMPRKTGIECLSEIKENIKLKDISVVMFSTFFPQDLKYEHNIIKILSVIGAQHNIRKPGDFAKLKEVIHNELIKATAK